MGTLLLLLLLLLLYVILIFVAVGMLLFARIFAMIPMTSQSAESNYKHLFSYLGENHIGVLTEMVFNVSKLLEHL